MSSSKMELFRDDLIEWGIENMREFPWRNADCSLYDIFIAEFFLTQTPAPRLERIYPDFLAKYPDLEAIDSVPENELANDIQPLGFQNRRASDLKQIADSYDVLPSDADGLKQLPGVGQYVVNSTICFTLHKSLVIYDRNVLRVYKRVAGEVFPESRRDRIDFAEDLVPEEGSTARTYNLTLLDFGALVCKASNPDCPSCFASTYCSYYGNENK